MVDLEPLSSKNKSLYVRKCRAMTGTYGFPVYFNISLNNCYLYFDNRTYTIPWNTTPNHYFVLIFTFLAATKSSIQSSLRFRQNICAFIMSNHNFTFIKNITFFQCCFTVHHRFSRNLNKRFLPFTPLTVTSFFEILLLN